MSPQGNRLATQLPALCKQVRATIRSGPARVSAEHTRADIRLRLLGRDAMLLNATGRGDVERDQLLGLGHVFSRRLMTGTPGAAGVGSRRG